MREVKEGPKLDYLHTDHVMIQSELKYLIGAKIVDLKCRVVGGNTAPFPTVRVFRVVKPVAMVRFRMEPNPVLTRESGPVANTSLRRNLKAIQGVSENANHVNSETHSGAVIKRV